MDPATSATAEVASESYSGASSLGFFADPSYTAQLVELQPAERGRKFASKDRRPLDPPPIVQLQIFRTVVDPLTGALAKEEIFEYGSHNILGCMCSVELYRALPEPNLATSDIDHQASTSNLLLPREPFNLNQESLLAPTTSTAAQFLQPPLPAEAPSSRPYIPHSMGDALQAVNFAEVLTGPFNTATSNDATDEGKCSEELFGTNVVQVKPVTHEGRQILLFVFGDIAVRAEGWFSLRYQFFDIFSKKTENPMVPVLAHCKGKPFRVYPSKEFPGLKASTELTMVAVRHGISVHVRQKERKRRKRPFNEEEVDDDDDD